MEEGRNAHATPELLKDDRKGGIVAHKGERRFQQVQRHFSGQQIQERLTDDLLNLETDLLLDPAEELLAGVTKLGTILSLVEGGLQGEVEFDHITERKNLGLAGEGDHQTELS